MAATAHAFLVSLMNTMDQIQIHPFLSPCFDGCLFESLRGKVDFFLDFVENYSDADRDEAEDLLRRIAASAHEAEDIIEVEAAERMRSGSTRTSLTFLLHLQVMLGGMNSIEEKVIEVKEETALFVDSMSPPPPAAAAAAAAPTSTKAANMVGFDTHLGRILDELTSSDSRRRILPIVGMGGIGKTTLARNVYENSLMLHRFDVRAWVTVSQAFTVRDLFLQAISCLGSCSSKPNKTDLELGDELHKILYGRRYLVVLDDMWSIEAWEKIKFYFPGNNNGSRIVVTTRQQELVDYFASSSLAVNLLDERNSWDLFCDKTFAQEGCPPQLEDVGREIVRKCKGLPLAITVIGGLLGKSPKVKEYWEKIAQDKSLILEYSGEGSEALSILHLSYKNLPVWLKSCFLYLGLFPEDHHIDVSQLIQLLIADGFVKANRKQSLEEVVESHIEELVGRNLLLVGDLRLNKKFRTCYLHDVVREMCIKIAEKENFYSVQRDITGMYHVIVDERTSRFYPPKSPPLHRFLYNLASKMPSIITPKIFYVQRKAPIKSRLLRVCVDHVDYYNTFQQLNLRFLDNASDFHSWHIPRPISLFWSLQTLKLFSVNVPSEIWKMPQLRHIEVLQSMYLPDPPKGNDAIVLHNLHTLKTVEKLIFSEELCRSIPNIKYLEIEYNFVEGDEASWCFDLHNVGCLNKLEKLKCFCSGMEYLGNPVQNLKLPNSLKELILENYHLVCCDMAMFSLLPHLQILQLHNDEGVGAEWNCVEEEFRSLKHLNIGYCHDLVHWNAEKSNFPVLETLSLSFLSKLEEIPSSIGEIATLEKMDVYKCSKSATISAIRILEEQESLGIQDLQVRLVISQDKAEADMWREKYPINRLLIPTYPRSNSFCSLDVVYDSILRTSC